MNKWRIYVAGIMIEVEGPGDFRTLYDTGLFETIEQVDYYQTFEKDNLWIYKVKMNGKTEIAVIKRTEQENKKG